MFKPFKITVALISFLFCLIAYTALAAEITITVKYPDGKPAKGIKVREVGLERGNLKNELLGITDDSGGIKTRLELKPTVIPNNLQDSYVYAYRYVVMPNNYRWEVSDIYWSNFPEKNAFSYQQWFANKNRQNWSIGKKVKISESSKISWNIILRKSADMIVRLEDQNGKPIKKRPVSVFLNLQANSHTGHGGEIGMFDVYTDDNGYITVHNAGNFYYSFDLIYQNQYTTPGLDYSSSVVMKRLEGRDDKVVYHKCREKLLFAIVKDKATGKPISGASIMGSEEFLLGKQGGPLGPDALTDANGIYKSDSFCTEHMIIDFHGQEIPLKSGSRCA